MTNVTDHLRKISIESTSPDETIRAVLSTQSGVRVEFERPIADLHSEESLENQIESVVKDLIEAYELEAQSITQETYGGINTHQDSNPKYVAFLNLCEKIKFTAKSDNSPIAIDWEGSGDIIVAIRSGTLTSIEEEVFISQANSIIQAAIETYSLAVKAAHKVIYLQNKK